MLLTASRSTQSKNFGDDSAQLRRDDREVDHQLSVFASVDLRVECSLQQIVLGEKMREKSNDFGQI